LCLLSLYLRLAPYGGNLEGIRAASLSYFAKEPRRLTPAESALLVAIPQSPEQRRPDRAPDIAKLARDAEEARERLERLSAGMHDLYERLRPIIESFCPGLAMEPYHLNRYMCDAPNNGI
jgi:hypothetical protein